METNGVAERELLMLLRRINDIFDRWEGLRQWFLDDWIMYGAIALGGLLILWLLGRKIRLWYWKQEQILRSVQAINQRLDEMAAGLPAAAPETPPEPDVSAPRAVSGMGLSAVAADLGDPGTETETETETETAPIAKEGPAWPAQPAQAGGETPQPGLAEDWSEDSSFTDAIMDRDEIRGTARPRAEGSREPAAGDPCEESPEDRDAPPAELDGSRDEKRQEPPRSDDPGPLPRRRDAGILEGGPDPGSPGGGSGRMEDLPYRDGFQGASGEQGWRSETRDRVVPPAEPEGFPRDEKRRETQRSDDPGPLPRRRDAGIPEEEPDPGSPGSWRGDKRDLPYRNAPQGAPDERGWRSEERDRDGYRETDRNAGTGGDRWEDPPLRDRRREDRPPDERDWRTERRPRDERDWRAGRRESSFRDGAEDRRLGSDPYRTDRDDRPRRKPEREWERNDEPSENRPRYQRSRYAEDDWRRRRPAEPPQPPERPEKRKRTEPEEPPRRRPDEPDDGYTTNPFTRDR